MGGNLNSYIQQEYFQSMSGVDSMNRKMRGYDTSNISRLFGAFSGFEIKTILNDFYLARVAINYCQSLLGGRGDTVFTTDAVSYYLLECEYSYKEFDIPVTLGLAIPFWKDMRISLNCGIAFARTEYENKFKSDTYSDPFERKGYFKGWAFPIVIIVQGEYFVSRNISLISSLSYYHGSTGLLKDRNKRDVLGYSGNGAVDFASINFSGYRFSFGVSYYLYSI